MGANAPMEGDSLMLITAKGKMIRTAVSDIRVIGRATQGVRLIKLDAGDKLVSATTVAPDDVAIDGDIDEEPEIPASKIPPIPPVSE